MTMIERAQDSTDHAGTGLSATARESGAVVVEVVDLTVDFQTRQGVVRAVDGVSFQLRGGETVAVVGESGSGKSVTGLSVIGLLPVPPAIVGGSVRVTRRDGSAVDVLKMPRKDLPSIRGNEIAMIFQEPMTSLNPLRTVGDQVSEPLVIHQGMSASEAWERAHSLLEQVGIPEAKRRLSAYPHEMSGGMRQRVMIAMALSCGPNVLIADEPTTALDVTIQAQILELFRKLQATSQMAVMFVTHDLGVVAEVAQRVLVMYAGQIVEEGPVRSVLKNPSHPYTRGLLASLPRIDKPQREKGPFYAIAGSVPEPGRMPHGCRFRPRCPHAVPQRCEVMPALEAIDDERSVRCVRWRELAEVPHV